jgi:hypothetical protein
MSEKFYLHAVEWGRLAEAQEQLCEMLEATHAAESKNGGAIDTTYTAMLAWQRRKAAEYNCQHQAALDAALKPLLAPFPE